MLESTRLVDVRCLRETGTNPPYGVTDGPWGGEIRPKLLDGQPGGT